MFLYYITILSAVLFYSCRFLKQANSNEYIEGRNFFLFLSVVILLALPVFRSTTVGTDTPLYYRMYLEVESFNYVINNFGIFNEPGFLVLQYLASLVYDNQFPLFFAISLPVLILSLRAIELHSKNKILTLYCFLSLGFYTFHFNGARQAIAIALFLYSLRYILSGNLKKYCFTVLIGFFFHKSILFCFPFYFVFRTDLNLRKLIALGMCSLVAAYFVQELVSFASDFDARYSAFATSEDISGGVVTTIFLTVILLWLFLIKRANNIVDRIYDMSLIALYISTLLGWITVILKLDPSGIMRLHTYFSQFMIFSIPISVMSFKNPSLRAVILILLVPLLFLYFHMTTTSFSKLYPYSTSISPIL